MCVYYFGEIIEEKKLSLFFFLWVVLKLMEVIFIYIREEMYGKVYFYKLFWIFNLV